jgi:hypothetical protein
LVAQHAPHWLGPSQAVSYDYIICIGDIYYIMLSLPPRHRELGCAHRESCMHVHACTQDGLADVTSTPMHCTACYCMFLIGLWLSLPWRKKKLYHTRGHHCHDATLLLTWFHSFHVTQTRYYVRNFGVRAICFRLSGFDNFPFNGLPLLNWFTTTFGTDQFRGVRSVH